MMGQNASGSNSIKKRAGWTPEQKAAAQAGTKVSLVKATLGRFEIEIRLWGKRRNGQDGYKAQVNGSAYGMKSTFFVLFQSPRGENSINDRLHASVDEAMEAAQEWIALHGDQP